MSTHKSEKIEITAPPRFYILREIKEILVFTLKFFIDLLNGQNKKTSGGGKIKLSEIKFEKYENLSTLGEGKKNSLRNEINSILADSWGLFPPEFLDRHVLSANRLIMARTGDGYIGFCAMTYKTILKFKIHYIEFLVTKRTFQQSGIGSYLLYLTLYDDIMKNFFKLFFQPLEMMLLTLHIGALTRLDRFTSFLYPNPYLFHKGRIPLCDNITWRMAKELIHKSDNPHRKLTREGLVLEGSYSNTPWLIYKPPDIPWHTNFEVNEFAKKYLGYGRGEDKEIVVRAQIGISSFIKSLLFFKFFYE